MTEHVVSTELLLQADLYLGLRWSYKCAPNAVCTEERLGSNLS